MIEGRKSRFEKYEAATESLIASITGTLLICGLASGQYMYAMHATGQTPSGRKNGLNLRGAEIISVNSSFLWTNIPDCRPTIE